MPELDIKGAPEIMAIVAHIQKTGTGSNWLKLGAKTQIKDLNPEQIQRLEEIKIKHEKITS